jgi:TrmH family RNA methyltransferase
MITSPANPRLKELKRILQNPDEFEVFAVEGVRALEEAIREGIRAEAIFYSARLEGTARGVTLLDSLAERGSEIVHVGEQPLDKTCSTEQSQGVVAVFKKLEWTAEQLLSPKKPVFLLDGIRDPGNLGTILRITDGFGLGGVVMSEDTVNLYNAKVIRSAMGSLFRVPALRSPLPDAISALRDAGYTIVRSEARLGTPLQAFAGGAKPVAIVLGNEAHGVRADIEALVPDSVQIEMPGNAESLNVAIIAGILAYGLTAKP